jgi:DNA-binding NtrC family response regulator
MPETREAREQQPDRVVTVLTVAATIAQDLDNIFKRSNWVIHTAKNCEQATRILKSKQVPVVLCERNLPDGIWTDLLSSEQTPEQQPVVIVTARHADESLWAEVLNLGGYDVLPQPFERSEVVRVISLAWMHWRNRCARAKRAAEMNSAPLSTTA